MHSAFARVLAPEHKKSAIVKTEAFHAFCFCSGTCAGAQEERYCQNGGVSCILLLLGYLRRSTRRALLSKRRRFMHSAFARVLAPERKKSAIVKTEAFHA